jgi:hypothetical protein
MVLCSHFKKKRFQRKEMPFWEFLDPKRIMSCKGKLVKDDISK